MVLDSRKKKYPIRINGTKKKVGNEKATNKPQIKQFEYLKDIFI